MLTKKQKSVFDYIKRYAEKNEYAPSLEEIQGHFKLASVSTAFYYINRLVEGGYLKREAHQARSISVQPDEVIKSALPKQIKSFSVPVLGSANAGEAVLRAEENIEGHLRVSRRILSGKDGVFALRVKGDSMNRAKIDGKNLEDDDFVLIDSEYKSPRDGDYVLSVIEGHANLKKFKRDGKTGQVTLISESTNTKHKPIFISGDDDFMINGKIISVVKK
ncbi:MAG: transcriptional repressor LexA [Patescibacteria group bacterium]|nr:transcriptional repressor LexA [Patescibacteria group bacterium]